jgi:hypothetical protein
MLLLYHHIIDNDVGQYFLQSHEATLPYHIPEGSPSLPQCNSCISWTDRDKLVLKQLIEKTGFGAGYVVDVIAITLQSNLTYCQT